MGIGKHTISRIGKVAQLLILARLVIRGMDNLVIGNCIGSFLLSISLLGWVFDLFSNGLARRLLDFNQAKFMALALARVFIDICSLDYLEMHWRGVWLTF